MRKLLFILLALASFGFAAAQVTSGTLTVAFGRVKGPDGKWRSIAGMRLPYTAVPIHADPIRSLVFGPGKGANSTGVQPKATTVYQNDPGSGYGVIESEDPSSLDDHTMANGANLPWQNLQFGFEIGAQRNFIIRWRAFTSYNSAAPNGVSAFGNEVADWGVIYPATAPGQYKITISVAAAGVVCPGNQVYLAQQFREMDLSGEGPFDTAMKNVYATSVPPQVGFSDDQFWYDWDPMDGIYSNNEIDNFGQGSFANLLRTITVSGTQETVNPSIVTLFQGADAVGDITDLWYSDDSYYRFKPLYNVARGQSPAVVIVEGLASSANITSLKFTLETRALQGNGTQRTELFNYTSNAYDVVDTRALSSIDSSFDVVIGTNPTRYVNSSTRRLRSRISFFPADNVGRSFELLIDRAVWTITKP